MHPLARGVALLDQHRLFVRIGRHAHDEPLPLSAAAVHRLVRRTCLAAGGARYAVFPAGVGTYSAHYSGGSGAALTVGPASTATGATASGGARLNLATNRASTAVVTYGTSATDLNHTAVDAEATTDHRISLPAASAGDTIYYRVTAIDTQGKTTTYPAPGTVAATATVPTSTTTTPSPPTISNISTDPLPDGSVSVLWNTDQATDGKVIYGTASGALTVTRLGSGRDTNHWVLLSQVPLGRRLYYRVISRNAAGDQATSAVGSFDAPAFGVADTRQAQWRSGQFRSGMSIGGSDGGDLTLAPGQTSGAYRSRLLDARQMVLWGIARWRANVPAGAALAISVRTGSTSTPDDSWTPWISVDTNRQQLPGSVRPSRYLQYRIQMAAGSGGSPVLHSIGFTSSGRQPAAEGEM